MWSEGNPRLLGNHPRGKAFILSAPAGTGKTTLVRLLCEEFPVVGQTVSYTTRSPRDGEVDGVHYHFVSKEEFERRLETGEFLEWAQVFGCYYGTSGKDLEEQLAQGRHMVLVIDTQGALQLMDKQMEAVSIFLMPPSMEALGERLQGRSTESAEKRAERLSWAKKEMELASHYDYQIVNDEIEVAYEVLRSVVIAEEHRTLNVKKG